MRYIRSLTVTSDRKAFNPPTESETFDLLRVALEKLGVEEKDVINVYSQVITQERELHNDYTRIATAVYWTHNYMRPMTPNT